MMKRWWQTWRERLRHFAGGAPSDAEPASSSPASDGELSLPTEQTEHAGAVVVGPARSRTRRMRLGVLRPINCVQPPIRISRPNLIAHPLTPTPMQNVPTFPLPLVKPPVVGVAADETALEERQAAEEQAAANAAWEALWALRGTRSTAAQPVSALPKSVDEETADVETVDEGAEARPDELRDVRQPAVRQPAVRQPAAPKPALPRVQAVVRPPEPAHPIAEQRYASSTVSAAETTTPRVAQAEQTSSEVIETPSPAAPSPAAPSPAAPLPETPLPGTPSSASPPFAAPPRRTLARRQSDVHARPQARRKPPAPPAVRAVQPSRQIGREAPRRAARKAERSVLPTKPLLTVLRAGLEKLGVSKPVGRQADRVPSPRLQATPLQAGQPEIGHPVGETARGRQEQQHDLDIPRPSSLPKRGGSLSKPKSSLPKPPSVAGLGDTSGETDQELPALPTSAPNVRGESGEPSLPAVEGMTIKTPSKRPVARRVAVPRPPLGPRGQLEAPPEMPISSGPPTVPAAKTAPPAAVEGGTSPGEEQMAGDTGAEWSGIRPQAGIPSPKLPAIPTTTTVWRVIRDRQDLAQLVRPTIVPATIRLPAVQRMAEAAASSASPEAGDQTRPSAEPRPSGEQARAQVYDLEAISRQVYQIVRHRLAVERERELGW